MQRFARSGVQTSVLLWWALLCCANALAQTAPGFGTVHRISGVLTATDPSSGSVRELKLGDTVRVGELVQAAEAGEAVVRTDDAGVIAVRPNTAFVMENFQARGQAEDRLGLRVISGALRLITGWVGLLRKDAYRVATPTTLIGIRGTDHEPYVLSQELALSFKQRGGTYNKVNRGATFMESAGVQVDIEAGKVGFAPAPRQGRDRALITALIPVVLERVPDFYLPGKFDAELESFAAQELSTAMAERKLAGLGYAAASADSASAGAVPVAATADPAANAIAASAAPALPRGCVPQVIAAQWVAQLDAAVSDRDAARFLALFDPAAEVIAEVKSASGVVSELRVSRDDFSRSTVAALAELSQFSSRRPVLTGKLASTATADACTRIEVESVAIESGQRRGTSYRIESLERFVLELKDGKWLAVKASTSQR